MKSSKKYAGSVFQLERGLLCQVINESTGQIEYITPPKNDKNGDLVLAGGIYQVTIDKDKIIFSPKKKVKISKKKIRNVLDELDVLFNKK
jgi:hypothetical protein